MFRNLCRIAWTSRVHKTESVSVICALSMLSTVMGYDQLSVNILFSNVALSMSGDVASHITMSCVVEWTSKGT